MRIESCSLTRCPDCGKRLLVVDSAPADLLGERGYKTVAEILQLTGESNIWVRMRRCKSCGCRVWTGEWALLIERPQKNGAPDAR